MTVLVQRSGSEPQAYVTEIWCPVPDDGIQRMHSPMPEPEPLPEPELEAEL